MAQKSKADRKRLTLREVQRETGISLYTLTAIASDSIKEYPVDVLEKLLRYFDCDIGDLLTFEEEEVEV